MPNIHETLKQLDISSGGQGSGRHKEQLDSHPDHGWLKDHGWQRTGTNTDLRWTHDRYPGKAFKTGKACTMQEEHLATKK